jgi:hypothetical protein
MKNFLLGMMFGITITVVGTAAYLDHRTNGKVRQHLALLFEKETPAPVPPPGSDSAPQPTTDPAPATVPSSKTANNASKNNGETTPSTTPKIAPPVHPRPEIADVLPLPMDDPNDPHPVQLGPGGRIGKRMFPDDNPWNQDISKAPVDPRSFEILRNIGLYKGLHPDFGTYYDGQPIGIPYHVVSGKQPKVPISFEVPDESDPGPYPIPPNIVVEGGPKSDGDRHILVLDRDNWLLYEAYRCFPDGRGGWKSVGGAIFDLKTNRLRRMYDTSADAAGLPILPGLVRYDEVFIDKEIRHALRFTVSKSRKGFVYPARHFASPHTDPDLPPMGMRVRLRADFKLTGYSPECQIILKALQKYGMFLADNGEDWFISGAPDPRWNDQTLRELKKVQGQHFEVIQMGEVITDYGR